MAMMLRHKPTGDIYVYTDLLSQRADMEPFDVPPPPAPAKPAKLEATVTPVKLKPAGDKS